MIQLDFGPRKVRGTWRDIDGEFIKPALEPFGRHRHLSNGWRGRRLDVAHDAGHARVLGERQKLGVADRLSEVSCLASRAQLPECGKHCPILHYVDRAKCHFSAKAAAFCRPDGHCEFDELSHRDDCIWLPVDLESGFLPA